MKKIMLNYLFVLFILFSNSINAQKVWNDWTQIKSFTNENIIKVLFTDIYYGWVIGENGTIYHTTNAGRTWVKQDITPNHNLRDICLIDRNNAWIASDSNNIWGYNPKAYIYHSDDGGISWKLQYKVPEKFSAKLNSIFIKDSDGYVLGDLWNTSGLRMYLFTRDNGQKWDTASLNTTNDLRDMQFVDSKEGWIAGQRGTILHTTNGGKNWEAQISPVKEYFNCVSFIDKNMGFILSVENSIIKTTNGGQDWKFMAKYPVNQLNMLEFVNQDTGWAAGTNGTIVYSSNGGSDWVKQETNTDLNINSLNFIDSNYGWAVGDKGIIFRHNPPLYVEDPEITTICAGDILYLPVLIKPGYFLKDNIFTIQLSDTSGSFENPYIIVTTKDTSHFIPIKIPDTIPESRKYRIRILSSNPSFTSISNQTDLRIKASPQPEIMGLDTTCENSEQIYSTKYVSLHNYKWSIDGGTIIGENDKDSVTVKWEQLKKGKIIVEETIYLTGCKKTVEKEVFLIASPNTIISGPNDGKVDNSDFFSTTKEQGVSIKWSVQGGIIMSDDNSDTLQVYWTEPGLNFVELIKSYEQTGCMNTAKIDVKVKFQLKIKESSNVCENDTITYHSSSYNNSITEWEVINGTILGENNKDSVSVIWDKSGKGILKIRKELQSINYIDSLSMDIIINPKPEKPIISQEGNSLVSSADNGNQWYLGGIIIEGATEKTYLPEKQGRYSVRVIDTNGCKSDISETFNFITEVQNKDIKNSVRVYPTPASDCININYFLKSDERVNILLLNSIGIQVFELVSNKYLDGGNHNTIIFTNHLMSGIYYIKFQAGIFSEMIKIVLIK